MNRPRDEYMVKTIKRLATTIKKKTASKSPKKKKAPTSSSLKVNSNVIEDNLEALTAANSELVVKYSDDSTVDIDSLKNYEFITGMTVTFESMVFRIIKNPPTITAIQIFPKSCVMVSYPVIATVTTEYADGIDYLWFCERDDKEIIFLSNEAILIPTEGCIGGKIKVLYF
jgi:hypothetical protein